MNQPATHRKGAYCLGFPAACLALALCAGAQDAAAQDWTDTITGRVERRDFEAKVTQEPNLYLLPENAGPARRFDFSASAPFQPPKDLPPDYDPKAAPRLQQLNPIEPKGDRSTEPRQ